MLPEWPHYSVADNDHIVVMWKRRGQEEREIPPFAMAKSYTCGTERGGPSPDHFFKQSKQSLPTVNKMKMSKAFRCGEGVGGG